MPLTSSDTKQTLMHLFLFTNSAQRELVLVRKKYINIYVRRVYATAINFPCIITLVSSNIVKFEIKTKLWKFSVYHTKHQIQGKSNFHWNIKFKLRLLMLLKNKKMFYVHNIKIQAKIISFHTKTRIIFYARGLCPPCNPPPRSLRFTRRS